MRRACPCERKKNFSLVTLQRAKLKLVSGIWTKFKEKFGPFSTKVEKKDAGLEPQAEDKFHTL